MYPDLVNNYLEYCRYRAECATKEEINLSRSSFFYPGTLLPTIDLIKKNPKIAYTPPQNKSVANYVELMGIGASVAGDTHCPIVAFPKTKDEKQMNQILSNLYKILDNGKKCGGEQAFKYVTGELTDNVDQHSKCENAYAMGQSYNKKGFTEICIFDDGKSIPGVFESNRIAFSNDCEAIKLAINGRSTKKDVGRGYGLGSSLAMLTLGLQGEVSIVSRSGLVYMKGKEIRWLYRLADARVTHQGTIIAIRIPFTSVVLDIMPFVNNPNLL